MWIDRLVNDFNLYVETFFLLSFWFCFHTQKVSKPCLHFRVFSLNSLLLLTMIITIILKVTTLPSLLIKARLEDVAFGLLAKRASNSEAQN